MRSVRKLLYAVNHEVAQLPDPIIRKLVPMFAHAERELTKDLQRWLRRYKGDEAFTTQHLRSSLIQVRSALKTVQRIKPALVTGLRKGAVSGKHLSDKHLLRELGLFGAKFGSPMAIPILPAAKIINKTLLDRYTKLGSKWSNRVLTNVRQKLAVGLIKGENVTQMANRLLGKNKARYVGLESPAAKAPGIAEAITDMSEFEAYRIVRTEVISAYNDTKLDTLKELADEDPSIQKRWDAAMDGRTCDICADLDHEVVAVDDDFSSGDDTPPAHPQCLCACVAWREGWDEAGAVKQAVEEEDVD